MCSFNLSKYMNNIISMDIKELKKVAESIGVSDIQQLRKLQRQVNNSKEKLVKNADNILPPDMQTNAKKTIEKNVKSVKIVSPQNTSNTDEDVSQIQQRELVPQQNTNDQTQQIDTVGFFGVQLPRSTFYLIIMLIIVGSVIWYMSGESKPKKKKNDDEKE